MDNDHNTTGGMHETNQWKGNLSDHRWTNVRFFVQKAKWKGFWKLARFWNRPVPSIVG